MFKRKVISFDIGNRNIKLVEGKCEGDKVIVTNMDSIETPRNAINDGNIIDVNLIAESIRKLLDKVATKTKNVVFTSQSTSIITRTVEIPWAKEKDMKSMIKYDIEQYLPIDLEEYIIKHKVIEEFQKEEVKMVRANVVVYPKKMAKMYWNLVKDLELKPIVLEVSLSAMEKVLSSKDSVTINEKEYIREDTIAIVDIGSDEIEMNIISNGNLEFTRVLMGGGSYIDSSISSELSLDMDVAEEKKKIFGNLIEENLSGEKQIVNEVMKNVIDRWNSEILRMLEYFKNKNKDKQIKKIYIHGGTSHISGLCEYMKNSLGMPVEVIKSISTISLDKKIQDKDITNYINAIGSIIM
ncbi:type IV pilus assembly protein PilM [Clostridium massiliodielmoense]|uniref:type IV pilus assembly protein PilM n=1 Tax=Clostridium massiliodielmoense TaxID=1776385 RepID=UPI0004DA147D|nr:type IV pilus assembly protein PilM [Clostridium massiliodielmoense]KEH98649.1 fimbrial assembly protein [Clostridium botulinum C/D str. BKT12695]